MKPTEVWGLGDIQSIHPGECTHGWHPKLIGLNKHGEFKTKAAQAYPSEMCKALAEYHLRCMIDHGPRSPAITKGDRQTPLGGQVASATTWTQLASK